MQSPTNPTHRRSGAVEEFLCKLPLEDNNAVFNLCCRLCSAYEEKAFHDGVMYGASLMRELYKEDNP